MTRHRSNRRGFTLIELLIVFAMLGLIMAMSVPKLRVFRSTANVRAARDQIASSIVTARAAAIQKSRQARFQVRGNGVSVRVDTSILNNGNRMEMTVLSQRALDTLFGVRVTVEPAGDSVLRFDSRGIGSTTSNGPTRYLVRNTNNVDTLCVTRFGLVSKRGCT